jgi:hypothetical protein
MRLKVGNGQAHGPRSSRHAGRMQTSTGELSKCGGTAGRAAERRSGTRAEWLGHR